MKALYLLLISFLFVGCGATTTSVKIPKILVTPTKKPTPPKLKGKEGRVSKAVAIYIIKLGSALDKTNLKLELLRELYPP
jgi:hypothetical protein